MTRSVLVVDDHPSPATSAAHALEAAGYIARVATSVDAALVELADRPDAVVLDHCLDRDASLLRMALVRARVPVVLVSGLDDEAALDVAGAHAWSFIPKPFDDIALVAAVASLFPPETPSMPERPSPEPRPTLVPDLPPAPASIAPREAPLPAPPPAAQLTPSGRPTATPAVQIVDHISDMVGMIILGLLCHSGKIGGTETLLAIGGILGFGTGLRQIGGRLGGAGVGVAGLAILGISRWLAPAAAGAELARASGLFGLLAVLALGVSGCGGTADAAALGAATTAIKVASEVRRHLCSPVLDPLLGDPRPAPAGASQSSSAPAPASPPVPAVAPDAAASQSSSDASAEVP